jgi:hypothetical protein
MYAAPNQVDKTTFEEEVLSCLIFVAEATLYTALPIAFS